MSSIKDVENGVPDVHLCPVLPRPSPADQDNKIDQGNSNLGNISGHCDPNTQDSSDLDSNTQLSSGNPSGLGNSSDGNQNSQDNADQANVMHSNGCDQSNHNGRGSNTQGNAGQVRQTLPCNGPCSPGSSGVRMVIPLPYYARGPYNPVLDAYVAALIPPPPPSDTSSESTSELEVKTARPPKKSWERLLSICCCRIKK